MYRHCPSCTRDLGENEALEHFPVGKRLAYDLGRGRLWVLCPRCRAWNLAPIEERWEAVEESERLFEKAEEGLATEHIALGRLPDGTELVRIGKAEGPELAGWRYANRISARWKRAQTTGGLATAAWVIAGPSGIGGPLLPVLIVGGVGVATWQWVKRRERRLEFHPLGREDDPHARVVLSPGRLRNLRLLPGTEEEGEGLPPDDWSLDLPTVGGGRIIIPGELRSRALRLSLLELNKQIGKPAHVKKAMDRVVEAGDSERLVATAAQSLAAGNDFNGRLSSVFGDPKSLKGSHPVLRLALEIAANEEAERIALEGELYRLQLEWREAEELAAISDNLLVPEWVNRKIEAWKRGDGTSLPD
jgi:hypothetical protein